MLTCSLRQLGWDIPEGLVYHELVKEYSAFEIGPNMVKESALELQYLQLMWCLDPKNRTVSNSICRRAT